MFCKDGFAKRRDQRFVRNSFEEKERMKPMFSGVFVIFWSTFFSRFLLDRWSPNIRVYNSVKRGLYKNGGSGFWKKFRAENVCGAVLMGVHSP